jgi:hypothetical protein
MRDSNRRRVPVLDLIEAMERNWSGLELFWTLMACLGLVLSSRSLSRVTVLVVSLMEEGMEWPTRRRLIKRMRDAVGAYLRHIGFLIVGIVAMASPPAPVNPDLDVIPGLAATLVFVAIIVQDIISLRWDEADWIAIVKALAENDDLWERLVADEERLQTKTAEQMGISLKTTEAKKECIRHDKD